MVNIAQRHYFKKSEKEELTSDEIKNELLLLQASLKIYWDKLDPAERDKKLQELAAEFGTTGKDVLNTVLLGSTTALLTLLQTAGPYVVEAVLWRILSTIFAIQIAWNASRFAAMAVPFLNKEKVGQLN